MSSMKTASSTGVWRYRQPKSSTYCPYKFGPGIDLARNATGRYADPRAQNHVIYVLVGAGQLFERSEDNPFKTFCRDDQAAIASDWAAVGADMWGGTFRVGAKDERVRQYLKSYLKLEKHKAVDTKKLRPKQLELFSHGK